jgi:HEAT repeat protein
VLLALGRESGEFEHVLEGSVNVIRILREDHLCYYALQSYEEAVAAAEKQGEKAAAATLAREMSVYARKEGLVAVGNFGQLTQARLWQEVAASAEERGVPPEIAENALLAAIIALGEAGQYQKVGALYAALAALPLDEQRRGHYARAASRYEGAKDLAIDASPLPKHLRHEVGFPDVWHVDLVEWEQRGSASEACADVVLDPSSWSEVTRRRAMLARLTALAYEAQVEAGATADPAAVSSLGVALADQLAQVELYSILSPLEHLFRRREAAVRAAVARALARCLYKRSFITLRDALADPDPAVQAEAARSLGELHFAHAFDPLARIYRESHSPAARAAALRALSRVDTHEAAELMLSVLEHDDEGSRAAAVDGLKRARGLKFLDLARGALPRLSGASAAAVRDVLQARGQAV